MSAVLQIVYAHQPTARIRMQETASLNKSKWKMLAKSVLTDKNKGSRTGVGWNRREPAKAWFEHVDSEEETGAKGEATHAEDWNCKQPELRDEKHNVLPFSIIQSIVQVVGFITGIRNKRNKVLTLVMDTTWLLCIARPKT